ncbi:hypothetical protein FXB39_19355 [Nocardioides sp. BGMRC 2183]|nr:hypothetical protein FXB39_19355 [Nocardioides sp. BGMRC 2183]
MHRPVQVDPAGVAGPTPAQARGRAWRRVGSNLYVPAAADPGSRDQRIVEALAASPGSAAATGWAALAWLGGRWFTGVGPDRAALDVPVALGDRRLARPREGIRYTEDWLFDGDVIDVDGLSITVAERAASFEARTARDLARAVAAIDMAAFDDLLDLDGMRSYVARLRGRPGIRQLRRALELAHENAWSPQETRMRLVWLLEVADRPLQCNAPVFDHRGQHLFTPDLLDPAAGIVGEYDGDAHAAAERRGADLDRAELARDLGIEIVTMVGGGMRAEHSFARRLRAAYRRAETRPASRRRWRLELPDWWVDTSTVGRRRALTEPARRLWLRRQAA